MFATLKQYKDSSESIKFFMNALYLIVVPLPLDQTNAKQMTHKLYPSEIRLETENIVMYLIFWVNPNIKRLRVIYCLEYNGATQCFSTIKAC